MIRFIRPGAIASFLFLLATAALAYASWQSYHHGVNQPLPTANGQQEDPAILLPEELRALFADVPPPVSQFSDVADKNLFSPDRKAWTPPPPAPKPKKEAKPEEPAPPPPPPGDPRVRLYGTTITPDTQTALLFFERFSSKQKHRIVQVGDTVSDDGDRGEKNYFILKKLEQDKATLEDPEGYEHVVGLFDHQRKSPPPAPKPDPESKPVPVNDATSAPYTGETPENGDPSEPAGEPIRHMEDIPESLEEREQLVKEGRLLKFDTPFGDMYRPVR